MYLRKRALERIAREKVLYPRTPGGDISVCVIYPNTYRLGMANLGFQAIFHIFESDPSVAADRAFLPDPDERDAFRLPQPAERSADSRDSRAPRRPRRPQFSADHRRRLRRLSQSRADRRFHRAVFDWRG